MKYLLSALFLAGIAVADQPQDDVAQLNGTWILVRAEVDGSPLPKEVLEHSTLKIDGDKHTLQLGQDVSGGTHRFDATTNPKGYDQTDETEPFKGQKRYGIYRLQADELTFCIASAGHPRPKDFTTTKGSDQMLTVWKRQSK
jgi:uncharacterized protein (TIGR03067 family)